MGNACRKIPQPSDDWTIHRGDFIPLIRVGKGLEGTVTKVRMLKSTPRVSVGQVVVHKELHQGLPTFSYENEIKILKKLSIIDHPNIIRMLGVSDGHPPGILLEYMSLGSLLDHVVLCKTVRENLTVGRCLKLLRDVACGMQVLTEYDFVHRDLAARNCLVNAQEVVKIADFGMSRMLPDNAVYYQADEVMVPVRWSAPETIESGIHYLKSDVWSFGVVVWEVFSGSGDLPYSSIVSNREVAEQVIRCEIQLERPQLCPEIIWSKLHEACCVYTPGHRPWFQDIINLYTLDDVIRGFVDEFKNEEVRIDDKVR